MNADSLAAAFFQFCDLMTLAVLNLVGNSDGHFHVDAGNAFAMAGEGDLTHHVERHGLSRFDAAAASAARTFGEHAFGETGALPLASHFQDAEAGDAQELGALFMLLEGFGQTPLDCPAMFFGKHVDKVADDEAAKVAQAKLAGDFIGGFVIDAISGFLGILRNAEAAGVYVDGDEGLGLLDDQ